MKNAMELPKCSKTFHISQFDVRNSPLAGREVKANLAAVNLPLSAGFGVGTYLKFRQLPAFPRYLLDNWPMRCLKRTVESEGEVCMNAARSGNERRKWVRLPLAIPVFVRSRDDKGKEFLEFATALNVSAGGMLVAVRRTLPASSEIELEIPSAPVAAIALVPNGSRNLRAKALRNTPEEGYYLLGLKFSRPLLPARVAGGLRRRRATVAPLRARLA
jgi:hypothetical protein